MSINVVAQITKVGQAPLQYTSVLNDASALCVLPNDGRTIFLLSNGNATTRTCTVTPTNPCTDGDAHAATFSLPGSSAKVAIGPFPLKRFGSSITLNLATGGSTDITVTALTLG